MAPASQERKGKPMSPAPSRRRLPSLHPGSYVSPVAHGNAPRRRKRRTWAGSAGWKRCQRRAQGRKAAGRSWWRRKDKCSGATSRRRTFRPSQAQTCRQPGSVPFGKRRRRKASLDEKRETRGKEKRTACRWCRLAWLACGQGADTAQRQRRQARKPKSGLWPATRCMHAPVKDAIGDEALLWVVVFVVGRADDGV